MLIPCVISSRLISANISAAVLSISSFWLLILTCATPVTEIGTPWEEYTFGDSTTKVIVDKGILCKTWAHGHTKARPPTIMLGLAWNNPEITMASFGPQVTNPTSKHIFSNSTFFLFCSLLTSSRTRTQWKTDKNCTNHSIYFWRHQFSVVKERSKWELCFLIWYPICDSFWSERGTYFWKIVEKWVIRVHS